MAEIPADPLLSPAFEHARKLSRLLGALFAVGLFFTSIWMVFAAVLAIFPEWGGLSLANNKLPLADLSVLVRTGVIGVTILCTVPSLLALHFARRVFMRFSFGEVFAVTTITEVRACGFWMVVVSGATPLQEVLVNAISGLGVDLDAIAKPSMFFVGIGTYVAAYVMAEARRIADDNASFV